MAKKNNQPKHNKNFIKAHPEVRQAEAVAQWDAVTVSFIFSTFDVEGIWGWGALKESDWKEVFYKVENYQTMSWHDILCVHKKINHSISVDGLSTKARKRLNEIAEDIDTIISLHLNGSTRLYGIRDRKMCRILWIDPWHSDPQKAVCCSHKK